MANITVRRVGILSAAMVAGVFGVIFGIIGGAIYAALIILGGSIMSSSSFNSKAGINSTSGAPFIAIAIGAMLIFPIFYGILSFIMGAIYAFFYNVVASTIGGLKMELLADD
jgi:hypothetical protein